MDSKINKNDTEGQYKYRRILDEKLKEQCVRYIFTDA